MSSTFGGKVKKPENTIPTIKQDGGLLMLWCCFAASGVCTLHRIEGIMRKEYYKEILEENVKKGAQNLELGRRWWFQHDNDPKHKAKLVTEWLRKEIINGLEWLSQSPDVNPIETLWRELKVRVHARHPKNIAELETICMEEWAQIPQDVWTKLVTKYNKRLASVIQHKHNWLLIWKSCLIWILFDALIFKIVLLMLYLFDYIIVILYELTNICC